MDAVERVEADEALAERLQNAAECAGKGYFDPRTVAADLLAASTRILALARSHSWQTIETAPTDGTEFQAWIVAKDEPTLVYWVPKARYNPDSEAFEIWGRTDYDMDGWDTYSHLVPTHYMLLPSPPHTGGR